MVLSILFTADVLHDNHLKFSGLSLMLSAAGTKVRVEGAALSDGQDRNKPSKIIKVFAEKTKATSEFDDTAKLRAMMRVFHQVQVIFANIFHDVSVMFPNFHRRFVLYLHWPAALASTWQLQRLNRGPLPVVKPVVSDAWG